MARYDFDARLYHWATWMLLIKKGEIGYPTKSSIANFKDGNVINNKASRTSREPFHYPEAEEINSIYNRLKLASRSKAEAIRVYYLKGLNVKQYAKKKKITPSAFYQQLRAARRWMEERLEQ